MPVKPPGSPISCRICRDEIRELREVMDEDPGISPGVMGVEMRRIFAVVRRTKEVDLLPDHEERVVITCTRDRNHEHMMPRDSNPIHALEWIRDTGSLESFNKQFRPAYAWRWERV